MGFLNLEIGPDQRMTSEQKQGVEKRDEIKLNKIGVGGSFKNLPLIMLFAVVISLGFSIAGLAVFYNSDTEVKFPLYRPELIYTYTNPDVAPSNSLQVSCAAGTTTAVVTYDDILQRSSLKDTYEHFQKKVGATCNTNPLKKPFVAKNSWESDAFSIAVYAHADTTMSPWPFTIAILWITFAFSLFRYAMWTLLHLYDPDGPQFFRWFEYVLSSPLMIVIIAVAAGVRDVWTVAALAGLQALLIMCGYLIETLVDDLWACYFYKLVAVVLGVELEELANHDGHTVSEETDDTAPSLGRAGAGLTEMSRTTVMGARQGQVNRANSESGYDSIPLLPPSPANSRAPSQCGEVAGSSKGNVEPSNALYMMYLMFESHDARPYTRKGMIGSACAFKYESGRKLVLFRLLITLLASWVAFIIIWGIILGAFNSAVNNYNDCLGSGQGKVPQEITTLVWSQLILFALFGANSLWQVYQAYKHLDGNPEIMAKISNLQSNQKDKYSFRDVKATYLMWYENYLDNWYRATEYYEILNIISKSFLAIAILQISANSGSS